jgi:hypothetical protein
LVRHEKAIRTMFLISIGFCGILIVVSTPESRRYPIVSTIGFSILFVVLTVLTHVSEGA